MNRKQKQRLNSTAKNPNNRAENRGNINSSAGEVNIAKLKRGRLSKTASRRRRERKKILMIALIIVLTLAGVIATFVLVFRVEGYEVVGDTIYSDNELIDMIPIQQEENIFFFNAVEAEQAILDKFLYVETVKVSRQLPSTVIIEVTPSRERYMMEVGEERFIISETMKTLRVADEDDLFCRIVGYEPDTPQIGEKISSLDENRDRMLMLIIDELQKVDMIEKTIEINITDTLNMEFAYDGRITVKLGSDLSMEYKMEMVAKILSENIQESEVGVIDASVPGTVVFNAI